jgi:hypothetical protein
MFFLLLVQKKEPKKSTPAIIPIAIGTAIAGQTKRKKGIPREEKYSLPNYYE